MGDVVNLRRIKKLRARAADKQSAENNRVRFGRAADQRASDRLEEARRTASLDGKRLQPTTPDQAGTKR